MTALRAGICTLLAAALASQIWLAPAAMAQLDDGGGDSAGTNGGHGGGAGVVAPAVTISSSGSTRLPLTDTGPDTVYGATRDATRPHTVTEVFDPPCYLEITETIDKSDPEWYLKDLVIIEIDPPICEMPDACGAERVDDLYTAWISGTQTQGVYHHFITWLGQAITSAGTIDATADTSLPWHELSQPPTPTALPVLWWCTYHGNYILTNGPYRTRLAWATTIEDEYPLDTIGNDLYDALTERINLDPPQPAAIPPLEIGHTYVKFPTWYWLNNPTETISTYGLSDLSLVRVELAAHLDHITWHLGNHNLTCTIDDMVAYDPDHHDPINDQPRCSHTFTTLDNYNLSLTATYTVVERITTRNLTSEPFPNQPWQPHPQHPTINITTNAGTHQVHELHALIVNNEIDY